jgi:hypothetical protein
MNALPTLQQVQGSLGVDAQAALSAVRHRIEGAYARFDAATPQTLHLLDRLALSNDAKEALAKIFKQRLGDFRTIWDGITDQFEAAGNSTCPYCNFGEQWEHDHYLPKSVFPEFSLYPKNLVPICKPCNGKKLTQYISNGNRLFLHLYSELNGAIGLLDLNVHYHPRVRVSYTLVNPGLQAAEFAVLERHFEKLGLARRYAKQASGTVSRLIKEFRTPRSIALGRNRLRRRIRRMAQDRAVQCPPNHWEVVLLQKLGTTSEFTEYIFS